MSVGKYKSTAQDFGVSALAAGLSHFLHHPLYTLKNQMMYYGQSYNWRKFVKQLLQEKHNFLYRGSYISFKIKADIDIQNKVL